VPFPGRFLLRRFHPPNESTSIRQGEGNSHHRNEPELSHCWRARNRRGFSDNK
jgi:hypothetical protein